MKGRGIHPMTTIPTITASFARRAKLFPSWHSHCITPLENPLEPSWKNTVPKRIPWLSYTGDKTPKNSEFEVWWLVSFLQYWWMRILRHVTVFFTISSSVKGECLDLPCRVMARIKYDCEMLCVMTGASWGSMKDNYYYFCYNSTLNSLRTNAFYDSYMLEIL